MSSARRLGWIDWLRALGACSIVLLHVFVSTSLRASVDDPQIVSYTVLGILLCRWAVPGFFMMSGYLLLDPNREFGWSQMRRYVGRMAVVLATFGLVFAIMKEALPQVQAGGLDMVGTLRAAVVDVLTMSTWGHLWYVYALAGIYALVPVIRGMGAGRLPVLTVTLVILGLVIPTACSALDELGIVVVPLPEGWVWTYVGNLLAGLACFCVGGCMRAMRHTVAWMALGAVSLAVMLLTSLFGLAAERGDQGYVFLQSSCFACSYALLVLLVARNLVGDRPPRAGGVVEALARDSFGIYLLHPLFIHVALLMVNPQVLVPGLFEVALFAGSLLASVACTRALRHLPVVGAVL